MEIMILAVYVDVLSLNKVSTLKPNIASNQFEKDLSLNHSEYTFINVLKIGTRSW